MKFAQNLAAIMAATDTSMYRLAKDIGVHQTTIKNWLSGEREPKIEMLQKLVEYFNISYAALLGDAGPDNNVLRRGQFEFSDDDMFDLTLVSIGPQMRGGVLYLPDKLLFTFSKLNETAIETVCQVAEGLSKLDCCQRYRPSDPWDPNPPEPEYDLLREEYANHRKREPFNVPQPPLWDEPDDLPFPPDPE